MNNSETKAKSIDALSSDKTYLIKNKPVSRDGKISILMFQA